MKKKIILPVIITAILVVIAAAFFGGYLKKKNNMNSSGRRDSYVEADLSAVDGGLDPDLGQAQYSKGKTMEDTGKAESVITREGNAPISENVEKVSEMKIPEAVVISEGDSKAFYSNKEFEQIIPADMDSFYEEQLPARYDSRDVDGKCYITEVEDQGYSYLCWTFSTLGAVEADILRHEPDMEAEDLDLSEKHLAYYNVHKAKGSLSGLIDDDYRELVNAEDEPNAWIFEHDTNYIAIGGVTDYSISVLTAWKGPVLEEGDDAFNKIYGQEYIFKDNGNPPTDGYNCDFHVQDVYEICASAQNRNMVKKLIMEHGAVTVGVYADNKFWKNHNTTLYSHFDEGKIPTPNHEVLIVGWDDDFDAERFSQKPAGNGAWICKNSWGNSSGENGYLYLSYYDEASTNSNVAAFSAVSQKDDRYYDNNYQVAGFVTNVISALEDDKNTVTAYTPSINPYGVLYTAKEKEKLKAVGLMSLDTYQQFEISVYLNPETDGERIVGLDGEGAVLTQKVSSISGGFHTFTLDSEIELNANDTFFILIKPVSSGMLIYEKSGDFISDPNYDEWNNLTGNFHNSYTASGLSYYISDDGSSMEVQKDKDFFIKAYTNDMM